MHKKIPLLFTQKTSSLPPPPPPAAPVEGQYTQALLDLMCISIERPFGRGDKPHLFDYTCDSLCDTSVCDDLPPADVVPTPFDLAPSRKRDWPRVDPDYRSCHLLQIYQRVRDSGLANMIGLRIPVPSVLNYPAWRSAATGHPDDTYVLDGVRFGFPLHYVGPPLYRDNRDSHPSAQQYWSHVQRYVQVESQNKAMIGPFDVPPFTPWTNISPIMTRPKADSTKRRIIVDLSFPRDDNVNAHVHKNMIFGVYHDHRPNSSRYGQHHSRHEL